MLWQEFSMILIKDHPFLTFVLILLSLVGAFALLWDSRVWFRRLISVLAPSLSSYLIVGDLRRRQDHEYLVSKVMQAFERRKFPLRRLPNKERRLISSISQLHEVDKNA